MSSRIKLSALLSTFCLDKSDGTYPHPRDDSLYIICRDGTTNVFECSAPLRFHKDGNHCNYGDVVSSVNSTYV